MLKTDASNQAVAGFLFQMNQQSHEEPISLVSRIKGKVNNVIYEMTELGNNKVRGKYHITSLYPYLINEEN